MVIRYLRGKENIEIGISNHMEMPVCLLQSHNMITGINMDDITSNTAS